MKKHGHTVINPALDDDDFDAAVCTAQAEYDQHKPDVIVGSSRGGAVAMNIFSGDAPLVLLCPAWKNWGTSKTLKPNSVILHSRNDDVIPFADSKQLLDSSGLPPETLIEVGNDHRLADDESLSVMLWACNLLASGEKLPWLDDESQSPADSASNGKATSQEEVSYICDACGEEIIIPLDLTEGSSQTYVEDCPVCCRANTIHVQIDEDGDAHENDRRAGENADLIRTELADHRDQENCPKDAVDDLGTNDQQPDRQAADGDLTPVR